MEDGKDGKDGKDEKDTVFRGSGLLEATRCGAFRGLEAGFGTKKALYPAKAVASMQACAVHLRDRTPRRCRVALGLSF
ncbi:MAG: hypothetical protein B7Z55_02440 [Planctomycetales bacterium 12-60-4]|nr:MAG: hypothetical protein B7Z55_02440 [Planctomycetales bacterium 12-60-4]